MDNIQISLAAARVNANLTQEEVARRLHKSKKTIVNWEKGKVIPDIPAMAMLSTIYKMPTDFILLPSNLTKSEIR